MQQLGSQIQQGACSVGNYHDNLSSVVFESVEFLLICKHNLQGEARIIVHNDGKKEAYSLDAASDLLAPLLKQSKGKQSSALMFQVDTSPALRYEL